MNKTFRQAAILTIALLSFSGIGVFAQQQTAQLTGRVTDPSGASVPGAKVTVANRPRAIQTVVTTNSQGDYVVPLLPPGSDYEITVSKSGFATATRPGITLQVAQVAQVNIALSLGSATTNVVVTGAPPLLDQQTSSVGQVIPSRTITALPLNGRSSFRLIQLTPGVVFSQSAYGQFGDVAVNTTWDSNFSVNGGRPQSNEILIDGVPSEAGFYNQITTIPSVDDTQEFKVQSNSLPAEYGRFAGGVINVTTKSGTNDLHGTVFEFLRNSALDANDYIDKGLNKPIPQFKMNQFGFAGGGPIVLPKLYNGRDRTFFFVDYQGTRRVQGSIFRATVPTDLQKAGDFSETRNNKGQLITIYNPFSTEPDSSDPTQFTRTAFDGNKIPSGLMDPVAQALLSYYPEPNVPGAAYTNANNYLSNAPVKVNQNQGSVRIDQNVTNSYHLFGRFGISFTDLAQPNTYGNIASTGPGAVGTTVFHNTSFALDNTITISPTLLFTVNYGFARWYQARKTRSYGFDNATLGFPDSLVSQIRIPMFPGVTAAGYSGLAGQLYTLNGNDTHSVLASLTKIFGPNTLIMGTDIRIHRINLFNVSNTGGSYGFARKETQGPNPNVNSSTAGDAIASMLMGVGDSGSMPIGSGVEMQDWYAAGYIQDNIRLANNFTLNVGLRYDEETPYTDRHDELNYFDPSIPSPARNSQFPDLTGGLQFAAVDGGSRHVYTWSKARFGPRFGFAYTPIPNTVVRGGIGLMFAPLEITNNAVGSSPSGGFSSSTGWQTSLDGGLTPFNLLKDPYPQGLVQPTGSSLGAGTLLGQSLTVWDHTPKNPQSEQWNFGVQRQFPSSMVLDVVYVGSRGLHLTSNFNMNALNPTYMSMGTALQQPTQNPFAPFVTIGPLSQQTVALQQLLLPYPQFTGVSVINSTWGSSNYHALQVKLNKRTTHGVSFLAAYTFSKLIADVAAQEAPTGPTDATSVQNWYDLKAERSVSEMNVPQSLIVNVVAQLPFGPGMRYLSHSNGLVSHVVGGWRASGILTEQSGSPLVLTAPIVGGGNRPNVVPGVNPKLSSSRPLPDKLNEWFNINAFSQPAPFTFGDSPRVSSVLYGPPIHNFDFSVSKDTKLYERSSLEFRAEAFNLTNTPHFGNPNTSYSSPSFGQVTSVLNSPPPRQIQFGLKLNF